MNAGLAANIGDSKFRNMKNKNRRWGVLVAFIALLLAAYLLPPLPKPKARALRIQTVNHVASISITTPGTNGLPAATKSK